jgi:signal transduction histidine kinase
MNYAIDTDELNQTLDHMISPMMLTNETDTPVFLNKAFCTHIGYSLDDLPNWAKWFEKAYPDPGYREKIIKSWNDVFIEAENKGGTSPVHVVSNIRCADGVSRWFDVHQHSIGSMRVITFLDIDAPMQRNADLANIADLNEKLLGIIAHDVRNPLSCFKLMVAGYEKEILTEDDVRRLLFKMSTKVEHVFSIINPLLLRISSDNGSFMTQQQPIDLVPFFTKYADYYRERLEKQGSRLVLRFPKRAVLHFDPVILDIICRNLLDNAIRFTGDNGRVLVSFKRTASHARLVIRDTGPGMSKEQIDRIMANKGSRQLKITDGFGIGLMMAKEFLEKHQGRLSIESKPGEGTAFIIEINNHILN